MTIMEKVDRTQRQSKSASVAVATFKKFSEDRSTNLAAMIAFWGFFSIFPLFIVLVTLLAAILPAADKVSVLGHVAKMLPVLDASTVSGLNGSWWVLIVGLLTALWSGTGVVRTQFAFDSVWEVPYHERLGMVKQTVRSVWVLATIGVGLVLTTFRKFSGCRCCRGRLGQQGPLDVALSAKRAPGQETGLLSWSGPKRADYVSEAAISSA